jgi:peptidoglycan/LPS O-acetylase OafA/YrhL
MDQLMPHSGKFSFNFPLQGLRGFLAAEIVLFHVYEMGIKKSLLPQAHWDFVDRFGPYAVYLFFCISGFLITQSLSEKHSVTEFLKIRAIRIYSLFFPLHILIFLAGPVVGYSWLKELRGHGLQWASLFAANLCLLPGMLDIPIAQQNAWSLSYEAVFYVLVAAIFACLSIKRVRRPVMFALWSIPVAAICWARPLFLFVLIGVAVLWLFNRGYRPNFFGASALALIVFVAGPLLTPYTLWGTLLCAGFFFAVVVHGQGIIGRVLSANVNQWLGARSYSLYLIHPFVLEPVRWIALKFAAHEHSRVAALFFVVAGPIMSVAVSSASYRLIECRLTNWLKRKLVPRRPAPIPVELNGPQVIAGPVPVPLAEV